MADQEVDSTNRVINKSSDSFRQKMEVENMQVTRLKEATAYRAGESLLKLFSALKCDRTSIVSQSIDLTESDKGYNGTVTYSINTIHDGDTKLASIPVSFKEGTAELPESIVVESVLKAAEGTRKKIEASLRKEVSDWIDSRNVAASLTKIASAGPSPAGSTLAPVLSLDKTWLPTDIKVGDLLFIGNAKYRVTSGDAGKLSADSDGSFWTMSLVSESADPKEEAKRIIY